MHSGDWKSAPAGSFKPYNVDTLGPAAQSGCLHPLPKVRAEIRRFLLEMGYVPCQQIDRAQLPSLRVNLVLLLSWR